MKRMGVVTLLAVWWATGAPVARAHPELDKATDELYAKITASMKKPEVAKLGAKLGVQASTCDKALGDPLPGVCKRLIEKLEAAGLFDKEAVDNGGLKAVITGIQVKSSKTQGLLKFVLTNGESDVDKGEARGYFVPGVGEIPPDPTGKLYPDAEALDDAWDTVLESGVPQPAPGGKPGLVVPNPVFKGNAFKASADGRVAVEVNVVKTADGRAGPRGFAAGAGAGGMKFVDLAKGDQFELIIHNESPNTLVAKIEIDGLDVLNAAKDKDAKARGGTFIRAKTGDKPARVFGWRKDDGDWRLFKLSNYEDSVAKSVFSGSPPQEVGTIHLTFYHAWPKGTPRPPVGGGTKEDSGVGEGDVIKRITKTIQLEISEKPIASIPIRYRPPTK